MGHGRAHPLIPGIVVRLPRIGEQVRYAGRCVRAALAFTFAFVRMSGIWMRRGAAASVGARRVRARSSTRHARTSEGHVLWDVPKGPIFFLFLCQPFPHGNFPLAFAFSLGLTLEHKLASHLGVAVLRAVQVHAGPDTLVIVKRPVVCWGMYRLR